MAARFDASRAAELGQGAGDSTPIMLTIPTDRPWVPLRILALGAEESQLIEADVSLLTDERPQLLAGGPGLTPQRSEAASELLLDDLRSDVGMEWLPGEMWLTYLTLSADAGGLGYDLAISADPAVHPSLADVGVTGASAVPIRAAGAADPSLPIVTGVAAAALVLVMLGLARRRNRREAA